VQIGGGHVDELERAFDAVKYRQFSERPHLEVRVPSNEDPSLAPAGHASVSILASYAPHALDGGWTEAAREVFGQAVVARLAEHDPGIHGKIVAREVLTPADLESEFALTGGQLHHGELALDQLLVMRPAPSAARYATSLPGLYLGGAGSHPGGGVRPTAGLLAAEAVLG
jgi:phytoene dehydrogenase-like protein